MIERFGAAGIPADKVSLSARHYVFNFPAPPAGLVDEFRLYYGPTMNAFEAAEKNGRADAICRQELDSAVREPEQKPGQGHDLHSGDVPARDGGGVRNRLAGALLFIPLIAAAAEPPPYDMAATPEATTVRQHALNRCRAAPSRTMREQIDCSLAAHRAYAVGTKLRDMGLFRDYAKTLRQAADDADAGRITPYEAQNRIVRAGVKFRASVENAYQDWHRRTVQHGPLYDRAAFPAALKTRDAAVAGCGGWTRRHPGACRLHPQGRARLCRCHPAGRHGLFITVTTPSSPTPPPMPSDGRMTPANLGARHQQIWTDFLHTLAHQIER